MRSISTEIRAAWRALAARPLATLAIAATLSVGLGATVAMFAVVDAVLLRPLPYPNDGELVMMAERHTTRPISGVSFVAAREWAALDGIASLALHETSNGVLRSAPEPVRVEGVMTSPAFFHTLGVAPALGRTPVPGDELFDLDPKIVLGDRLWREQFGARAGVLGEIVRIDNRAYTVVGVMPPGFSYPGQATFWTTMSPDMKQLAEDRLLRFVDAVARMRPGVDVATVNAQLRVWADGARAADAKAMQDYAPGAERLRDVAIGSVRPSIIVTFAAVGVLLVIACCNVAAMLLAQGRARARALAVQTALGASRAQLVRQLLVEGLLLSAAGGAGALLIATLVRRGIVALSLDQIPRIDLIQVDGRVVLFVALITLTTTIIFALGPALAASRVDSSAILGRATRTVAGDHRRLLGILVAAEFALALTLVVSAGLLINSYRHLQRVDLGFVPAGAGIARLTVPVGKPWNDREVRRRLYNDVLERARVVPGVTHAGFTTRLPLDSGRTNLEAWPAGAQDRGTEVLLHEVSEDYLAAVGAKLIAGRDFTAGDTAQRPNVAIINDIAARRLWPGQSAIGQTIEWDFMQGRLTAEVVGVVAAVRYGGLQGEKRPELYATFRQGLAMPASLVFRADSPLSSVAAIRAAVREAEPTNVVTMDGIAAFDDRLASQFARPRFFLALVGTFATIAFVLAALGIYGTLSCWIAERRRELGIRLALGATRRQVARLVIRRGLALAGLGLGVGVVVTLSSARYLQSLLFGVSPTDPMTIAAAVGVLGSVAVLGCWLPARRAAGVDPLETLRD